MLRSKLTAAGLDIDPSAQTDGAGDAMLCQNRLKSQSALSRGRFSLILIRRVKRDNIHVA